MERDHIPIDLTLEYCVVQAVLAPRVLPGHRRLAWESRITCDDLYEAVSVFRDIAYDEAGKCSPAETVLSTWSVQGLKNGEPVHLPENINCIGMAEWLLAEFDLQHIQSRLSTERDPKTIARLREMEPEARGRVERWRRWRAEEWF